MPAPADPSLMQAAHTSVMRTTGAATFAHNLSRPATVGHRALTPYAAPGPAGFAQIHKATFSIMQSGVLGSALSTTIDVIRLYDSGG